MNLNAEFDFDLKRFFRWWGKGLAYWIPEQLKQLLTDRSGYVYLHVTEETYQFSQIVAGQNKKIAELAFNTQGLEPFQRFIEANEELKKAHLILRLDSEQAIKKVLYLPAAAKTNIRQVLEFEMNKYTPFESEQVYFAFKQLGKEENGQIRVLLLVTPKEILDSIYLQLNSSEIYPDIVECDVAANNFHEDLETYNLLPEWERPVKNKVVQMIVASLGLLLILLTIAVLVFPVWNEERLVDSLKIELKKLQKETQYVQSQQLEIEEMIEETERLEQIKRSAPVTLELMNNLSQLVKDDTWLTHLQFKQGRLQIQGQSPTAEVLIGILEASPLFSNVRFVSPLTQDKRTGLERFQISLDVNAREGEDDEG